MILSHYYSYKIVVRKLIYYAKLKRMRPMKAALAQRNFTRDIGVQGNNMTHKQNVSYLYYNNLVNPDGNGVKKQPSHLAGDSKTTDLHAARKSIHQAAEKIINHAYLFKMKSGQQKHKKGSSRVIQAPQEDSVKDMESVNSDLGAIFDEADLGMEGLDEAAKTVSL